MSLKYSSNRCSLTSITLLSTRRTPYQVSQKQITKIKMNNQTKLLILIYIKKHLQKRNSGRKFKLILGRINLLRMLTRTIMDNSVLILSLSQETQRRYWAMEYEQSWFDKMWRNRHNIYCELWQKEFRMSPSTFEYIIVIYLRIAKSYTIYLKLIRFPNSQITVT